MKFSIKDCFSKCNQIRSFLWIWWHLLKKSITEIFVFCVVLQLKKLLSNNMLKMDKMFCEDLNEDNPKGSVQVIDQNTIFKKVFWPIWWNN